MGGNELFNCSCRLRMSLRLYKESMKIENMKFDKLLVKIDIIPNVGFYFYSQKRFRNSCNYFIHLWLKLLHLYKRMYISLPSIGWRYIDFSNNRDKWDGIIYLFINEHWMTRERNMNQSLVIRYPDYDVCFTIK